MIIVEVKGLEEINRALTELPPRIAMKVLRRGVYAGAALLRGAIKEAAPVRQDGKPKKLGVSLSKWGTTRPPGYLKKNIGTPLKKRQPFGQRVYSVGPIKAAFYGKFVEFGHRAGSRKTKSGLQQIIGTISRPHPFAIPAFNSMHQQIVDRMKERLAEGIEKEWIDLGFSRR